MKILHIAEPYDGGVICYLTMLLPRLEQLGVQQYFICSKECDKEKFERFVDGVEQVDLRRSLSPIYLIRIIYKIRRLISNFSPDILYCHSSFAGVFGRIAAIGLKCKVVYNPHGWAFNISK